MDQISAPQRDGKMIDKILERVNSCQDKRKYTYSELMEIRKSESIDVSNAMTRDRKDRLLKSIIGRSGILPIHQGCTIDNYVVSSDLQMKARDFSKSYIYAFNSNFGKCFIFSGKTGTGKNHLSASICNSLMMKGKNCLIITVNELMIKSRECYGNNPKYSEAEFLKKLIDFDLLVIDEVGLQKGTDHEKIMLNQIVDQRVGNLKPIGILTNLEKKQLNIVLGERIIDRLRSNGRWIEFNWNSYR